jgi:histidinol phosphatase-like enzyme (inositol monophosphatase family)
MHENSTGRIAGREAAGLAHRLADAAGRVILPRFRTPLEIVNKANTAFDPVTEADRAAERAMRDILAAERPEDGILGEEYEAKSSRNGLTWVLDPVDGTRAFIAGIPVWGTLIALNDDGRPILGMIDQPYLRERYWGYGGEARALSPDGEKSIRTRKCASLGAAILSTTTPEMFKPGAERDAFEQVAAACRFIRFGCDCYAYAMLAAGLIDLVVESALQPYDIQAPMALVEAAGGVVTDWRGGPAQNGGQCIAAGDPAVHEQALELLQAGAR